MDTHLSPAAGLLALMSFALLAALAVTLALRALAAARLGPALHRARARPGRRLAALAALALLGVLACAVPGAPTAAALLALGLSVALVVFTPAVGDTAVGPKGVQAGWQAARLADLEEWRLTGEHLRWCARGEWLASEAPPEHHPALRAALESQAGERESRFQH